MIIDFIQWWLDHWPLIPVLILFLPGLFNDFRQLWLDWSWYHAGYYFNREESRFTERRVVCRKCDKRQDVETVSEYGDPVIGFGEAGKELDAFLSTGGKP